MFITNMLNPCQEVLCLRGDFPCLENLDRREDCAIIKFISEKERKSG